MVVKIAKQRDFKGRVLQKLIGERNVNTFYRQTSSKKFNLVRETQ